MDRATKRKTALAFEVLASLGLASLLWAGCATQSYPGPVHGLTFDGTLQSIDLKGHRLILVPLKPSQPVVFSYEEPTKFWKNEIPIRANEVESGRSVRIHYHAVLGQPVAHHVYLQVPNAAEH